jgi:hypothetical protein
MITTFFKDRHWNVSFPAWESQRGVAVPAAPYALMEAGEREQRHLHQCD